MTARGLPAGEATERERVRLTVRGVVQGVGFRPFVYRQATKLGLAGWVANSGEGVTIEVEGAPAAVAALSARLRAAAPANARIEEILGERVTPTGDSRFAVAASLDGEGTPGLVPDLATCDQCLRELRDRSDRRYRFPFINCTECGPRYTIVEALPYDRARTSMRHFAMCSACATEYADPAGRRFHAEPNACPVCGPRLSLVHRDGSEGAAGDHALSLAATAIREGRIVALKGLSGFHLIADARNAGAVAELRRRKRRPDKPFAVMFPSLGELEAACTPSPEEEALVTSRERPIVLMRRRKGTAIADAVAPGNPWLGAMLPYTPLHHLLLAELGFPVVATSGNRSGEPIAIANDEALASLGDIADLFLMHDRDIVRPVDDSVLRVVAGRPLMLRRARGYVPLRPVAGKLPPGILALGAQQKSTVALTAADGVGLSQHLGDLDTVEATEAYDRALDDIVKLARAAPKAVACDPHPGYYTAAVAKRLGLPAIPVQHHLAHVAACMAEHDLRGPVLGVAFDGTGYGTDGTIWGGEFLVVDEAGWRRAAHLHPFRLPGGEVAVHEPRRAAIGLLFATLGPAGLAMTDLPPVAAFPATQRAALARMIGRGINAPVTTSAGRLFDGVAALLGLRQVATFEGQAAMELEWAAEVAGTPSSACPFAVDDQGDGLVLDWRPALRQVLDDIAARLAIPQIAARFHAGLAAGIVEIARRIGIPDVVLTGGCFQNAVLGEAVIAGLRNAGMTPHWHHRVPPNDGGIALGQAVWAARALERREAAHVPGGTR